jgi:hypothetical protein
VGSGQFWDFGIWEFRYWVFGVWNLVILEFAILCSASARKKTAEPVSYHEIPQSQNQQYD